MKLFNKQRRIEKQVDDKKFNPEYGFTNSFGYKETDPYIFIKGSRKVVSLFDLLFIYGTHNPDSIGWVTMILPADNIPHCQLRFFEREQGVLKSKQKEMRSSKIAVNLSDLQSTSQKDIEELAKNGKRSTDIQISSMFMAQGESMIDTDIKMAIYSDSTKHIEEGLMMIRNSYHNNGVDGVQLVRETGRQLDEFRSLLTKTAADTFHNTDMATVAGDRMLFPSSGFSDKYGVSVGIDQSSLIYNNAAIIDFDGIKNAVIYMGEILPVISINGFESPSAVKDGGSAVAQVISDGNYLSGGRNFNILLAGYPYCVDDSLYFDMSKKTINPLEVFGTPETVAQDANNNFDKMAEILLLVMRTNNTKGNVDDEKFIKSRIQTLLEDWFINTAQNHGIYTSDPERNPEQAQKILATEEHSKYPTTLDFLTSLNTNMGSSNRENEDTFREAKLIYESTKRVTQQYPHIFAHTTNIPDDFGDARNIYFDLQGYRTSENMAGVLFLNTLAYVVNKAQSGDIISIHGMDQMNIPVENIVPYKKIIKRKEIGLITTFESKKNKINPFSYEEFTGTLSQQDMVVLGGISDDDVKQFNKSWNKDIPQNIVDTLKEETQGLLYWYRKSDQQGALIQTHLLL